MRTRRDGRTTARWALLLGLLWLPIRTEATPTTLKVDNLIVTNTQTQGAGGRAAYRGTAEGENCQAGGDYAHAEGYSTTATGTAAHAEGGYTLASNDYSHAEGSYTVATGKYSHAEGYGTTGSYFGAHAEGMYSLASGNSSHAQNRGCEALGYASHAGGFYARAKSNHTNAFIHAMGATGTVRETAYPNTAHFERLHTFSAANDASNSVLARWECDGRYAGITNLAAQGDLGMGIYTNRP